MDQYKTCYTCKQSKSVDSFNKRRSRIDGLDDSCRECTNAKKRAWNAANRDKVKAMNHASYLKNAEAVKRKSSAWAKNNWEKAYGYRKQYLAKNYGLSNSYSSRRRSQLKQNQVFFIRPTFLLRLYASPCAYCGSNGPIEADHVVPVSLGGRHSEGNLLPACQSCNRSKHNKLLSEWRLKR